MISSDEEGNAIKSLIDISFGYDDNVITLVLWL